jgi:hypothetical protein
MCGQVIHISEVVASDHGVSLVGQQWHDDLRHPNDTVTKCMAGIFDNGDVIWVPGKIVVRLMVSTYI